MWVGETEVVEAGGEMPEGRTVEDGSSETQTFDEEDDFRGRWELMGLEIGFLERCEPLRGALDMEFVEQLLDERFAHPIFAVDEWDMSKL